MDFQSHSRVTGGTSRRDFLRVVAAGTLGVLAPLGCASRSPVAPATPVAVAGPRRVLRVAHLTDMHVEPVHKAGEGFAACLRHVQDRPDPPQAIFFGGDCVMDSMENGIEYTNTQWSLWRKVAKAECSLPTYATIGNHDMWGWVKDKSATTGKEPLWGKARALEALGLAKGYHSFDLGGWHFVFLDSLLHEPDSPKIYRAGLDEEQYEWLERDLAAVGGARPVMVVSHIPIYRRYASASDAYRRSQPGWMSSGRAMHTDYERLTALFAKHRNVMLSVAGHLHLREACEKDGVTYLCNGSVCGSWWTGKNRDGSDAGYCLVDLFDDGSFRAEYVEYGWQPAWDA
jgi:Icc protein